MTAPQAAQVVRKVDNELWRAVYPYDELRPSAGMDMDDVGAVTQIRQHLHRAEDLLDTGVGGGPARVPEAMAELREAYNGLDRLPVWRLRNHHEVVIARAEALSKIGRIVGYR